MIGILTFFQCYNYGAYLQAYALHNYLLENGYPNELIDYRTAKSKKNEYKHVLFRDGKNFILFSKIVFKIIKFKLCHLKLKRTVYIDNSENLVNFHYDTIIIGSDQIWCYTKEWGGLDPVYFSDKLNADNIISYAASMGSDNYNKLHPRIITRLMKNFSHIGVRDTNTYNFAAQVNADITKLVLDPTLIYDFKNKIIEPKHLNYILFYSDGFTPSEELVLAIKEKARHLNVKIISVGKHFDWCDNNLITLTPFQWMGYIKNAVFIFTCMYHGLLFSIKHNKQFALFLNPERENKSLDMLKRIDLANRIVQSPEQLENAMSNPIQYDLINIFLAREIKTSEDFIKNSLIKM